MGNEKELQNVVIEQAAERTQGIIDSVENLRRETGGINNPEITLPEIFELPNHEVISPLVSALNIPQIYDEEKNGDVNKSKTWKDITDKRKQDKGGKKK